MRYLFLIFFAGGTLVFSQNDPQEVFGELFETVQSQAIFADSKTFADCNPLYSAVEISKKYNEEKTKQNFDLALFVKSNFSLPVEKTTDYATRPEISVQEHIRKLWKVLTRIPDNDGGSLIVLPKPYIVPGGRFREIYYWDSYFTMLGLQVSQETEIIENMTDNFAYLIRKYGFIPNGNRAYYLSRSQPPFFSLMVGILAEMKGDEIWVRYLPALEKEYCFWMEGIHHRAEPVAHRRLVILQNGDYLNRYWDDHPVPRSESYKEDMRLARDANRPFKEVFQNIRASCESGWDFSSRWCRDGKSLSSLHTTEIIPVDLNCLLYNLEKALATAYRIQGEMEKARSYENLAAKRQSCIRKYCWDEEKKFFFDYDFRSGKRTEKYTLAALYPLFFKVATQEQADEIAKKVESDFLKSGGVVTTLYTTGHQWDSPNGWAPLQWITIQGLRNYAFMPLAHEIKQRWVQWNVAVYKKTGKMMEKYNVVDKDIEGGGGEYPLQDGFGWTNGVLLKLLMEKE